MKNSRRVTKNNHDVARIMSPDGGPIMFITGDESEGRFSTHEQSVVIHTPASDLHSSALQQDD